jgi:RNA 2',3'-cyclic 3'-phosphodiesterase
LKTERLFISLRIDEESRGKIAEIQQKLRLIYREHQIKWEEPDKFHLTLRFIGDFKTDETDELTAELSGYSAGYEEISINSTGTGFFPNPKRPRIIYLGFKEEGNKIPALVDFIDEKLGGFGIAPDKPFVPHLTLGRFRKENKRAAEETETEKRDEVKIKFDSFYLMQSKLDFKGSKYFVKKEFKFKK